MSKSGIIVVGLKDDETKYRGFGRLLGYVVFEFSFLDFHWHDGGRKACPDFAIVFVWILF